MESLTLHPGSVFSLLCKSKVLQGDTEATTETSINSTQREVHLNFARGQVVNILHHEELIYISLYYISRLYIMQQRLEICAGSSLDWNVSLMWL